MAEIELIGVPFDGYGRPGNQARASAVLREAGIVEAFAGHEIRDGGDLDIPAAGPRRGAATSLINEAALVAMTDAVETRVRAALTAGRTTRCCTAATAPPFSGRCPPSDGGLVFVDGHEDTMPLDVSEDGEAANTEVGLLLGLTGRLLRGPLARRRGALAADRLGDARPTRPRVAPAIQHRLATRPRRVARRPSTTSPRTRSARPARRCSM